MMLTVHRLTHNQTRFLMNEFARQPHPDASHRERLSREIPGLSPRQVQVWFQNRCATVCFKYCAVTYTIIGEPSSRDLQPTIETAQREPGACLQNSSPHLPAKHSHSQPKNPQSIAGLYLLDMRLSVNLAMSDPCQSTPFAVDLKSIMAPFTPAPVESPQLLEPLLSVPLDHPEMLCRQSQLEATLQSSGFRLKSPLGAGAFQFRRTMEHTATT